MSPDSVTRPAAEKPAHDTPGWRRAAWISFVAGIIACGQMLATAILAFLPYQRGNVLWEAIVLVTSPGLPVAFVGLVFGIFGLRSPLRRRAAIGMALSGAAILGVFLLILVAP